MIRAVFFAVLVLLSLGGPARAQDGRDLLGDWAFKTETYRGSCVLSGYMTITPGKGADQFACTFRAQETCNAWTIQAEEACIARRGPEGLSISSTVKSVRPPDHVDTYQPDHFALDKLSPNLMTGTMRSPCGGCAGKVEFRRVERAIS